MSKSADVDVIILSWNRVEDTIAAVRSATEQVGVDHRIQIVDQGSEPGNLAALEACLSGIPRARLHKSERNLGVAGGRNAASAMGTARYIVALDSDAIFADPRSLQRAVAHLDRNPGLCALAFRIENFYTGRNDDSSWDYPGENDPYQRFETTRFIGAGHAIRRSTFEAVGGYDERLFFCGEELDLCYRMLNTGQRIDYVPDVAIRHKVSSEHRVFWGKGRFFYTTRNNIYSSYKFGQPLPRLAVSAAAFVAKGFANGIPGEAVRAIGAAYRLCRRFDASQEDKTPYRLSKETWQYILDHEPSRREDALTKAARQFRKLPHQA